MIYKIQNPNYFLVGGGICKRMLGDYTNGWRKDSGSPFHKSGTIVAVIITTNPELD